MHFYVFYPTFSGNHKLASLIFNTQKCEATGRPEEQEMKGRASKHKVT